MIISLFGGTVVRPGAEDEEARWGERLEAILRAMPGFISYKTYAAEDGEEVSILRMASREALAEWVRQPDHRDAQGVAHTIYEQLWVQTAETYREAIYEGGEVVDRDLTDVFLEEG
jgi:heme-degrading monooxygenase HmoA